MGSPATSIFFALLFAAACTLRAQSADSLEVVFDSIPAADSAPPIDTGVSPPESASAGDTIPPMQFDSAAADTDRSPTPSPIPTLRSTARPRPISDTLAGNLPRVIESKNGVFIVTSDIYVPSGKTVTIKPGTTFLFRNFTEMHIEGRLIAEGTPDLPIVFTSEFDQTCNPGSTLRANPYDWNGIFIHEGGLGSSLAHCSIRYTVYGVNSLSKYVKFDQVTFTENGRSDLTIEGTRQPVSDKPYSYALTINDAKKDGIPVNILMDPRAKKRTIMRYGGFSLAAGGISMGIWSLVLLDHDQKELDALSDKRVIDQDSPIVAKQAADWEKARSARNRDRWMAGLSFILAATGSLGATWSFRF